MFDFNKTLILGQNENPIEVSICKSARAKKISIRISSHKGVELVIPKNISPKKGLNFLYSKEKWIINKYQEVVRNKHTKFIEGEKIPIKGKLYKIHHSGNLRGVTYLESDTLWVSGASEYIEKKVTAFLKKMAKYEISCRASIEATKLGVKYKNISIKDTKSRWGSCSHNKNLSFSWRLILAPQEVLEYVVAHEISHLIEMNHSKSFWNIVENICPEHQYARKWLKENGQDLHSYG